MRLLNCGHACQSHFYITVFAEEESVVNGSFSRIQLSACFFCFVFNPTQQGGSVLLWAG